MQSMLYWLVDHWKAIWFLALCAILGGLYGYHTYTVEKLEKTSQDWQQRAQTAEAAATTLLEEKVRLSSALEAQEQATAEAQHLAFRRTASSTPLAHDKAPYITGSSYS